MDVVWPSRARPHTAVAEPVAQLLQGGASIALGLTSQCYVYIFNY